MSSKQLVYLLMVLVVCCSVAGGIAHGQSTGTVTFKGTVLIDDNPAPGITITGENSAGIAGLIRSVESRDDGSYLYGWISFSGVVSAGDTFTFTLTDSEGDSQETAPYTLTAVDTAVPFTVDLDLVPVSAGITVQSALSAIPADGTSTSTITAMVRDDSGNPAAGDTVTISADKGTVGATTDNGDGTYSATYTAPSLALTAADTVQISAESTQLGETATTSITLTSVPTTVTVTVEPSIFSADTPGTGTVTISVDRAGPVADETVTISAPTIGTVGAVTNNDNGTYSATYISGGTAGRVTLTATATQADESGSAIITISAGAPAEVTVSAVPTGVSSGGSSIITAMVSDSSGNALSAQSLTASTSSGSGTITEFTESTARPGSYSATYTAPVVTAEGTETITVTVGTASGQTTLQLTPVPPVEVGILDVGGTVFMADGETPVAGVKVEVTVGSTTVMRTTDMDGAYVATFLGIPEPVVARGGDPVSIVVTDANDGTHGPYTSVLSNDELGEGGTAAVKRDVTTDIPVPPRTVNILVVNGIVYTIDGETPAEGVNVTVTVGSNELAMTTTDTNGFFERTAVGFDTPAASTGDLVSIVVTDDTGAERGAEELTLTSADLGTTGSATVTQDVTTDIPVPPRTVNILVVNGIVYTIDGETPAEGVNVTVTVGLNALAMTTTDMNGFFERTAVGFDTPAASTGDMVSIVVTDDTGAERGAEELTLTSADLGTTGSATVTQDVMTDIPVPPTTVNILVVNGVVYTIDGETPAEGVNVVVTVGSNALPMTTTDMNGFFERTVVGFDTSAASTGDVVSIVVTDDTGAERGAEELNLTNAQLGTTGSATVTQDVMTDITLPPKSVDILVVDGVVYRDDMMTPVDSGFDVTVTAGTNEPQTVPTGADGSFSVTFLEIPPVPVATTGDMVSIIVTDSTGTQRGPGDQFTLTHLKLAAPTVTRKVYTDIGATSKLLNVVGTVYLKDGDGDPVAAARHLRESELTVVVANSVRNLEQRVPVDSNGEYAAVLISFLDIAAETGDSLTVEVEDEAGMTVGEMSHTLTTPEVQAVQAMVNVHTNVPAKVGVLNVVGTAVELNGTAAGAGIQVTITLAMDGQTMPPVQVSTDVSGGYEYTFFDPPATIATTGDVLMVDVLRSVDGYHGHAEINPLRSIEIIYRNQPLVVDPIKMLPPIKALGGLSINPQYVPEELKRISREAIQTNPVLLEMIPAGILYLDLMKGQLASLPAGFDPTNDAISKENFGNAIAPKPVWHVLGQDRPTDPNRWLNGDLLNLYVLTGPTADSVMFTLSGGWSLRDSATRIAAGDTVPHTFQLEEDRALLFLPSWPGVNDDKSVFLFVDLMIDGRDPIRMTQNMSTGVWEGEAQLMPASKVFYYYQVQLAQAYEVDGRVVANWAMPDPRNLQVQDRGIVETLLAPELGPDLVEIVTTMDLQLRSVLNVPAVNALQSLWVYPLDLTGKLDGMYQLDTVITHADTVITTDSDYAAFVETIGTQTFMVDRSAPTADLTLAPAESSGMYRNPDGSYVAAAHADGGTLTITATPTGDSMDPGAYLYQIISLDAAGNPGVNVWNPAILTTDLALTYMDPHQVTLPISGENSLMGQFGLRAVGINDILNISSSTPPTMLEVVPLEYDNAAVTVVHADYNGDGTTDGRFESVQHVSDGVTIFSDRSTVTLTLEITEHPKHPLTSIAVDFQINGEGGWKPIKHFTAAELLNLGQGSELTVNWDRTEDFAGLLDMRGQATVRVTVANVLDVVSDGSIATFEIVPPALQLGGLSINTSYEAGLNALQGLRELDVTALATNLLGMDLSALISPSPLPLGLALLGTLNYVQSALPAGFETADPKIRRENFGNAITPKPIWHAIASADQQDAGRWINGNQLHLYTLAGPTAESLTFSITGAQTGMATASKVETGGYFKYNFQLEEELVAIFAGSMPAFAAVTLMIDGQAPIDMVGHAGVWSAEADLAPGRVTYYYRVMLAQPYQDRFINKPIQVFPIPDPRNLQMAGGYTTFKSLITLLNEGVDSLDTLDPGLRSSFTVPAADHDSQSLWVGRLDLPVDGMYQLDVAVGYSGGSTDALTGKMFAVDRTAPTADTMVHDTPDDNIGMYHREDGVYVATALPDPGKAILNVSATPIDDSDLETYLYQFARLDAAGTPGTWNPMLTMDLQALELTNLLPLTSSQHIQMLVRSGTGNDLDYGTYGLRVVGIDNILNADSSRAPGVVLELVPPDPDSAMVALVQADHDGDGTTDDPYETQSTAGNAVIFSDSMVTLTVDITEHSGHPLTIELEYQVAGGEWHPIGTFSEEATNADVGGQLTVNWHVGDYAALPDITGQVMVRTTATNALTISRESEVSLAYQRRLAPEIAAIDVQEMVSHPDSGAAQDGITVTAFTHAMTNPTTSAVQFEARRSQDTDWQPIGSAQLLDDTTVVSNVQIAIIEDLVGAVVSGASTSSIAPFYRQWTISVDTTTLEDTILDDTPAASDASLDDNPYIVRAIAVDAAGASYPSADGVMDSFSVDNYSPTEIREVANEVEMVAPREVEAGQVSGNGPYYRVSGLLLEGVPEPMLTLTARTGAYPGVFPGGIKLAITDASSGATLGVNTVFEDDGNYTYKGEFNLASIPNGIYNFMAVAHAADGSPETRIVAMAIIVEVRNFTPPENFADPSVDIVSIIDTEGDVRSPSEIDAMYPIGFPTIDDKLTFTLTVSNVDADEIDVLIGDDERSARMLGALTDDGIMITVNADGSISFEIMLDTSMLDEGPFNLVGTVTKPNGAARFGLPVIRVDRSAPVVEIVSPVSRHQIDVLPAIQITYTDASGFDPNDMAMNPMPVEITLTRLPGGEAINVDVSRIRITAATVGEILTQIGNIVYTHDYDLAGGAYRIEAMVTDILGNVGTAEPVEFTVESVRPTVSIVSPLIGVIVDPKQPLIISAALTGNGEITVTEFQINGTDMEGTLENNWLTYTMQPPLIGAEDSIFQRGSDNTISIKIVDSENRTAEGAISFAVSLDSTPPVISGPSPEGEVTRELGRITAQVADNESNLTRIQLAIDDNPLQDISFSPGMVVEVEDQTGFSFADAPLGTHSVTLVAESTGGSSALTWTFTIVAPEPTVSIVSPLVGQIVDPGQPLIVSAELTGAGEITVTEFQINGMDMEGTLEGNRLTYMMEPPLVAAADSILRRGSDNTISIKIVDSENRTAEGAISFAVSLEDPTVSITSPLVGQVVDPRQPLIVSADLTGDGEITVTEFQINGMDMEGTLEGNRLTYMMEPPLVAAADSILRRGSDNTISIKIVDSQGLTAEGAVSFAVSLEDPTVSITSPLTGQVIDPRQPLIVSADLTGDGEIMVTEFQINGMDMEGTLTGNRLTYMMEPPLVGAEGSILRRGGDNTISVKIVDSQGLTAEGAVSFAVSLEDPTVSITSPLVGQVVDPRQPLIVSADLTGDGEIMVTEFQINGMDMEGTLEGNRLTYTMEPPLVAAADSILQRGSDNTISIKIVDSQGLTAEGAVSFAVSLEDPTVSITSPLVGQVVDPRQPLIVSADLTGDGEITVTEFQINGTDMEGTLEGNRLTYTMEPPLIDAADSILRRGSDNTISVKIVDSQGLTAEGTVSFAVTIAKPTVTIITPAPGQVVDADQPLIISAALTGSGEITVDQLLINGGTYTPQSVKGNLLTHIIQPPFGVLFKRGSGNRITIKIVDEEGNTAEATSNFAIAKDVTPPVVATYSPLGIIRTDRPIAAATVTDASGINTRSLTIIIAGVPGNQGTGRRSSKTSTTVTFTPSIAVTPGPYTARVTVEDVHGNRTEAEWQFTVELDVTPPSITISSPHGVIRSDKPIISVSASDDMSGVDTIEIGVKGEGNQTVAGVTSVRSDKTSATFTPTASLTSGTYTVDVKLADMRGNKASGQWQFTVELDTIPPAITITRPMQEHTENRRPIISASYTDNLSGVDAESVKISLDGSAIEPDAVSETQVMFTPEFDLTFGQHTVKLEVSDLAPSANTAVQEWSFFVERMGIANARNYPNPFEDDTTIAFRISRQASITVQIYDFTGRLVAEPISNSVREAGPVEIPWDGQTNAGDSLARGVYFCHILMESELEPQSTILKMAIISD